MQTAFFYFSLDLETNKYEARLIVNENREVMWGHFQIGIVANSVGQTKMKFAANSKRMRQYFLIVYGGDQPTVWIILNESVCKGHQ